MSDEGQLIAGRYRLVEKIGRGGMGTVWRAEDELLGRLVAVKQLYAPPHLADDELTTLHERTRREARSAARITHPNVVVVHDVLDHEGLPCIVMEYVPSTTLGDLLKGGGTISPDEAARIGRGMIAALRAAHAAGVLHRDVKPGNVLLGAEGRVVLTDFGIAIATGTSTLTKTGEVVGSIDYIAPERVRGRTPGPASDLWALGATLYQAVEGRPPFRKATPIETGYAIAVDPVDPPKQAGPLTALIEALLAKEPEERPTAEETERALRAPASDVDTTEHATPGSPPAVDETMPLVRATKPPADSTPSAGANANLNVNANPPADATPPATPLPHSAATPATPPVTGRTSTAPNSVTGQTPTGSTPATGHSPTAADAVTGHSPTASNAVTGHTPTASNWGTGQTPTSTPGTGTGTGQTPVSAPAPTPAPTPVSTPASKPSRDRGSRAAMWSAMAAALAVVAVAGGIYLSGIADDDKPDNASGGTTPTKVKPSYSPPPVPEGYHVVKEKDFGISFPIPDGWTRQEDADPDGDADHNKELRYLDPSKMSRLMIDVMDLGTKSQVEHFQELEPQVKSRYEKYERLRLQGQKFRTRPGAIWEFRFKGRARWFRAIDLGFGKEGKKQYAIYLSAPASDWDKFRPVFDNVRDGLVFDKP